MVAIDCANGPVGRSIRNQTRSGPAHDRGDFTGLGRGDASDLYRGGRVVLRVFAPARCPRRERTAIRKRGHRVLLRDLGGIGLALCTPISSRPAALHI